MYEAMKRYQAMYLAQAYERQREFLFEDADTQQQDLFPSAFVVLKNREHKIATTCTWTEGVSCLLPKTDSIGFVRIDPDGESAKTVAEASWEEVQAMVPEQLVEQEMFPPRFLTSGFPSDTQLRKLGMKGLIR